MPYTQNQAENVVDAVSRTLRLTAKIAAVNAAAKIVIDEDDDLSISNAAQLTAYVNALTTRRDNIIAAIKPVVAGW